MLPTQLRGPSSVEMEVRRSRTERRTSDSAVLLGEGAEGLLGESAEEGKGHYGQQDLGSMRRRLLDADLMLRQGAANSIAGLPSGADGSAEATIGNGPMAYGIPTWEGRVPGGEPPRYAHLAEGNAEERGPEQWGSHRW